MNDQEHCDLTIADLARLVNEQQRQIATLKVALGSHTAGGRTQRGPRLHRRLSGLAANLPRPNHP